MACFAIVVPTPRARDLVHFGERAATRAVTVSDTWKARRHRRGGGSPEKLDNEGVPECRDGSLPDGQHAPMYAIDFVPILRRFRAW
jgi:hypothetical protein